MSDELSSFLEGEPVTTEEPTGEPQTEPPQEETPAEPEPEAPEPEAKPETAEEGSPPEPEKPSGTVPIAALLDEREKRQRFERELEELRKAKEVEPAKVPDVLDDQEGFVNHFKSELQSVAWNTRVEISQDVMRAQHEDYDTVEAKFVEMVKENPELARKLSESTMPAKFAYETVKKAERLAALENVDEWEAKKVAELKAQVRAELEAEITKKAQEAAAKESSISPSISTMTAEGGNTNQVHVPDPLESTFNR